MERSSRRRNGGSARASSAYHEPLRQVGRTLRVAWRCGSFFVKYGCSGRRAPNLWSESFFRTATARLDCKTAATMPIGMSFHMGNSRSSQAARAAPSQASARELVSLREENAAQAKQLAELTRQLQQMHAAAHKAPVDVSDGFGGGSSSADALRGKLMTAQKQVSEAQAKLNKVLVAAAATSRAGHLRSLPELIGPPPSRTWDDEWVKLKAESYRLSGQGEETVEEDEAYVREHDSIAKYVEQEGVKMDIEYLIQQNWPAERARTYALLFTCADALGRALRERDPCYAASTYALGEALFAQRQGASSSEEEQKAAMEQKHHITPRHHDGRPRPPLPQPMYAHLNGLFSLAERDPAWEQLEIPDGTGFRGLTSSALVHASCDPMNFSEEGFCVNSSDPNDPTKFILTPQHSDVVCFVSNYDDEHGAHSAIVTSDSSGDFPPNTLFRLKCVYEPGEWEAPAAEGMQPVFPMQRLLEVTATYQPPRAGLTHEDTGGSKMCGSFVTLSYNKREAFYAVWTI